MFSTAINSTVTTAYLAVIVAASSAVERVVDGDTPVSLGAVLTCAAVVVSGVWWFGRRDLKQKIMHQQNQEEIKRLKKLAKREEYLTNRICHKLGIDTSDVDSLIERDDK